MLAAGDSSGGTASAPRILIASIALASLAVIGWLSRPILTGAVYTLNDLEFFHLPLRAFYAQCLQQGQSFLWYPYQFTGLDLHGEGQLGMLHPLNWLSYRVLRLETAFDLEVIRSFVFSLAGTWFFLRRWRLDPSAALFGAAVAGFSCFNFLHLMHPNLTGGLAHLPWLLFCVDVAMRETASRVRVRARAGAVAGLVALTASQLLLGHPQAVVMSMLAVGAYAIVLLCSTARASALILVSVALALGVAAASVQVIPTFEALLASQRAAPGEGFAATLSPHPLELGQLVAPYLLQRWVLGPMTWEYGVYSGALPLALAAWLLLRRRALGSLWPLGLGALVASGIGLLLALGDAGGIYRLLRMLPLMDHFRLPGRYIALFQFGLAVVSAVAFHDLVRLNAKRERLEVGRLWPLAIVPVLGLFVATLALTVSGPFTSQLASAGRVAAGPLLALAAAGLVFAAARGIGGALLGIALFGVLEPAGYGLSFLAPRPPEAISVVAERAPVPPGAIDHRILVGPPSLAFQQVRMAEGYMGLPPVRVLKLSHRPEGPEDVARLLAAWRVASVGRVGDRVIANPLPRVRLVSQTRESDDPWRDLAHIDVAAVALVDRPLALPAGAPGRAEIIEEEPGAIRVVTSADTRQLLVVSESHHAGWTASVDGAPCDLLRVYGDFMGCEVAAGEHEVRFHFAPPSLRRASWISAAAILTTALWILALARHRV